jgi:DNA-binding MarR family transcriptional regulator
MIGLFVFTERRAAEPILPLKLFRNGVFASTSAIGLVVGFALFGSVTYLPLFLQIVDGASPTGSGLQLLPLMGGLLITSVLSGQLISRTGRYKPFPILGTAVMAVGLYLLSLMTAATSTAITSLYMLVLGLGLGLVMQVLVLAVQNAVDYSDLGVATSGATLFRSIGGSLGTSLLGAIFSNRLAANLTARLAGTGASAGTAKQLSSGALNAATLRKLPAPLHTAFIGAFTASLNTLFLVAALVTLSAFALSWLVKQLPLRETVATAGVGEAFAVPKPADSRSELLRGLTAIVGRQSVRQAIERIAARAKVDLPAAECWLLGRVSADPGVDVATLVAAHDVPRERVDQAVDTLRAAGLIRVQGDPPDSGLELTPAGVAVRERLRDARRDYLTEVLAGWSPDGDAELKGLIDRLAQDLSRQAPALAA